ncbi:hypothetical protein P7C70_g5227, partial [Phenoliferia sp. Uapishka_3]
MDMILMILGIINERRLASVNDMDDGLEFDAERRQWVVEDRDARTLRLHTLSQCCLVSQSFRSMSEGILYRRIDLSCLDDDLAGDGDSHIVGRLLASPRLAGLVKTLYVYAGHDNESYSGDRRLPWIEQLLPLLRNLDELRISAELQLPWVFAGITGTIYDHAQSNPQWQLQVFSLCCPEGGPETSRAAQENLFRMLSALPSTLQSLTLALPFLPILPDHISDAIRLGTSHPPFLPVFPPEIERFTRLAGVKFSLRHLHIIYNHFHASLISFLTGPPQSSKICSIVVETWSHAGGFTWPTVRLTVENLELFCPYALASVDILGFEMPHDSLRALVALPATLQSLRIPATPDVARFLASDACPKLNRFEALDVDNHQTLKIEPGDEDEVKNAVAKRGLFLVAPHVNRYSEQESLEEGDRTSLWRKDVRRDHVTQTRLDSYQGWFEFRRLLLDTV